MQIYHVQSTVEDRHDVDPLKGIVVRREEILKESSLERLSHPEHGTFERRADGTFEVPDDFGRFLLSRRMADGVWKQGKSPFAKAPEAVEAPKGARRPREVASSAS